MKNKKEELLALLFLLAALMPLVIRLVNHETRLNELEKKLEAVQSCELVSK